MGLTSNIIKLFFGSKSDKDAKTINPIVDKVLAVEPSIKELTNDQLRQRTQSLRDKINAAIEPQEKETASLKSQLEGTDVDVDKKAALVDRIDVLKKEIDKKIEEVLEEILPEAFAIMKDTARRFTENATVEVAASESDIELARRNKFVTIEGEKAIYNTTWRVGEDDLKWDMIHYNVQLFGGIVLHRQNIAEMATGEGKTLVATLPVFLNALAGKGVHVVTVNDYLARRDAQWMGPMYQFHGLTVDCIDLHQPNSDARRKAYASDIIFGTNNEFGFDYLRDNLATSIEDLVQRKHHFAIIDEADSILIDDARTPLIISGQVASNDDELFNEFRPSIDALYKKQREMCAEYLNKAKKLIEEGKTEEGGEFLFRSYKGFPKNRVLIKFLSDPEMKRLLLHSEKKYLENQEKLMPEVKQDILFVVDEKNRQVELTDRGHEELSKRYGSDDFFVLQHFGDAAAAVKNNMAMNEAEKEAELDTLREEHSVKAERVHAVNQLLKAYSLFENDVDYVVQNEKIMIVDEQTGRILDGRRYSDGLHQAIEAKEKVKVEAASQTVATITLQNYFRMYHKISGMTGTAETEAGEFWDIYKLDVIVIPTHRQVIRKDADDLIYRTKREKYNAVIDEVVKLVAQGRPVLVGTTSVEISEFLSRSLRLRKIDHSVLNAKLHESEAQIVAEAGHPGKVTIATNMAGRGTDIKLTPEVKAAGGLAIVGTERHDSRRVDRQLRGRAGRQGDNGSSQFFVSLEDDLMRLFGAERISKVMTTLKMDDGEPIQAGMISRAIENAQKKVEENNFGMRKKLLEYDNVMNDQRSVIYTRRYNALSGERIEVDLNNMIDDFAQTFADVFYDKKRDFNPYEDMPDEERFKAELFEQLSIPVSSEREDVEILMGQEIAKILFDDILMKYDQLQTANPTTVSDRVLKGLHQACTAPAKRIAESLVEPIKRYTTDFKVSIENYRNDLEKKLVDDLKANKKDATSRDYDMLKLTLEQGVKAYKERFGKVMIPLRGINIGGKHELRFLLDVNRDGGIDVDLLVRRIVQSVVLEVIDVNWQNHLREMDDLKTSVQSATYEQKDPVLVYKLESYGLFSSMLENVNNEVISSLLHIRAQARDEQPAQQDQSRKETISRMQTGRSESPQHSGNSGGKPAPAKTEKLVGRNDPCPCGSGKKFKNCHGAI